MSSASEPLNRVAVWLRYCLRSLWATARAWFPRVSSLWTILGRLQKRPKCWNNDMESRSVMKTRPAESQRRYPQSGTTRRHAELLLPRRRL